jgi:hypothetical protein
MKALNLPDIQTELDKRMSMDAQLNKVTLVELSAMLDALNKPSSEGKRDADKSHRDQGIDKTALVCQFLNEIAETGKTNMRDFRKAVQDLQAHMYHDIGNVTMIWVPTVDFAEFGASGKKVNVNPLKRFVPYIGGWDDGSKNPRFQYTFRKVPISKVSGYRKDAFDLVAHDSSKVETPIIETKAKSPKVKKVETPKAPKVKAPKAPKVETPNTDTKAE